MGSTPELESADDFGALLRTALDDADAGSTVELGLGPNGLLEAARIDDRTHTVDIDIDAGATAFVMRFEVYGVPLARGTTHDLAACVSATGLWQRGTTTRELRLIWPFADDKACRAEAYERAPVEARWAYLRTAHTDPALIDAAHAHPRLRVLAPASSLMRSLHLTRPNRGPGTHIAPSICPVDGSYFIIRNRDMPEGPRQIGCCATIEEAIALVEAHLPDNRDSAVDRADG